MLEALGVLGDLTTLGGLEVVSHTVVEGEHRRSCADFSTHVADSSHTRAGEGVDTRTSVLDDSTSSTLDSKNTSDLEDDIYRNPFR